MKRAANKYVDGLDADLPPGVKTIVRVFANVKGLAKTYRDAGIIDDVYGLDAFISGFNMADPLCEIVNAGVRKECADEKLRGKNSLCMR